MFAYRPLAERVPLLACESDADGIRLASVELVGQRLFGQLGAKLRGIGGHSICELSPPSGRALQPLPQKPPRARVGSIWLMDCAAAHHHVLPRLDVGRKG